MLTNNHIHKINVSKSSDLVFENQITGEKDAALHGYSCRVKNKNMYCDPLQITRKPSRIEQNLELSTVLKCFKSWIKRHAPCRGYGGATCGVRRLSSPFRRANLTLRLAA